MQIKSGTSHSAARSAAHKAAEPNPPAAAPGGRNVLETAGQGFLTGANFVTQELLMLGRNDPALALRQGATTLMPELLRGADVGTTSGTGQVAVTGARLAILGANLYRLNRTLHAPDAKWYDKGLDGLRVATDLVGVAGAALRAFVPAHAELGNLLIGTAYTADAFSHAYRAITHTAERGVEWKRIYEEHRAKER
jgi:hypothetical protein